MPNPTQLWSLSTTCGTVKNAHGTVQLGKMANIKKTHVERREPLGSYKLNSREPLCLISYKIVPLDITLNRCQKMPQRTMIWITPHRIVLARTLVITNQRIAHPQVPEIRRAERENSVSEEPPEFWVIITSIKGRNNRGLQGFPREVETCMDGT